MASSWALVVSTAVVWVILGSASGGEPIIEQQEINNADGLIKVVSLHASEGFLPESCLQRPLTGAELLAMIRHQDKVSIIKTEDNNIAFIRPGGVPEVRDPANPYELPVERYPVQFPLGRPTSDNLQAICLNGDRRPRYPKSYFPCSGFSGQGRKGSSVNKAEAWFSVCCNGNPTWTTNITLCCLTRAWEQSIKVYCREEFSIKTSHFHCCKESGNKRLNCFNDDAPNPNYEATEEIPMPPLRSNAKFKFDPSICQTPRYAGLIRAA